MICAPLHSKNEGSSTNNADVLQPRGEEHNMTAFGEKTGGSTMLTQALVLCSVGCCYERRIKKVLGSS